jgi:hypothetical protein
MNKNKSAAEAQSHRGTQVLCSPFVFLWRFYFDPKTNRLSEEEAGSLTGSLSRSLSAEDDAVPLPPDLRKPECSIKKSV